MRKTGLMLGSKQNKENTHAAEPGAKDANTADNEGPTTTTTTTTTTTQPTHVSIIFLKMTIISQYQYFGSYAMYKVPNS